MIEPIEAESARIDWHSGGNVHNWKNHVPEHIQALWQDFSRLHRIALYQWAQELASREEWE